MAKKPAKKNIAQPKLKTELLPDYIYRPKEAMPFFGFRHTQFGEKIANGEIPRPMKLSETGHAVGWLGKTIIEWQQARMATANR